MSATGIPSLPRFRMNASCASENLDAFIVFRSSQPGNQTRKTLAKNGPVYWEQINDPLTANYCLNNDGHNLMPLQLLDPLLIRKSHIRLSIWLDINAWPLVLGQYCAVR